MKLSAEQILPFLFGAAEISVEGDCISAYKCTAKTREAWGNLAPFLKTYASHTTGIRLDFHTDAEEALFTLSGGRFEIKVDGVFLRTEQTESEPQKIRVSLPEGCHRVTLIYPSMGDGRLYGLELPGATAVNPHVYDKKILFLGDSITQGSFAHLDSLSYAWRVSEALNADCIIHGVGGGYFHPDIFEAPADFDPHWVVVALGTNDYSWGYSLEELRSNTAAYLAKVKKVYGTEKVRCLLPIWRGEVSIPEPLKEMFVQTVALVREEEEKAGFSVIDGLELVPPSPEFFTEDLLHPNSAGFEVYAKNLLRFL